MGAFGGVMWMTCKIVVVTCGTWLKLPKSHETQKSLSIGYMHCKWIVVQNNKNLLKHNRSHAYSHHDVNVYILIAQIAGDYFMLDFTAILVNEIYIFQLFISSCWTIGFCGKRLSLRAPAPESRSQWRYTWRGICFCVWRAGRKTTRVRGQGGAQWNSKRTWHDRFAAFMNWQQQALEGGEWPVQAQQSTLRNRRGLMRLRHDGFWRRGCHVLQWYSHW